MLLVTRQERTFPRGLQDLYLLAKFYCVSFPTHVLPFYPLVFCSFVLCSLSKGFPWMVLRPPAAVSSGVTQNAFRPPLHIYRIRISEGVALDFALLRSRCSASMTDRYILLLASLVRNKLFLPLFWLLDFFLLLLFFLITTSWQQSKERGDLYMSYRRISTSGSHCSQEVDYSCYAHEGSKPQ